MSKSILSFLLLFSCLTGFAQEKKSIEAVRISTPPKIDGVLMILFGTLSPLHPILICGNLETRAM